MNRSSIIILLVIAVMIMMSVSLSAFTPANGNQTISSGTTWFTDTGGWPGGVYQNGENYVQTLYPAQAGYSVTLDIWDLTTESGYDYLRIYNGPSTGYSLLAQWHGTLASIGGRQQVTSSAADGSLTIWWYSDGSVVADGWAAYVSIVQTAPSAPTMYSAVGVSSTSFTANWSNSSASNYYLEIATNSSFSPNTWESWVGNVTSYGYSSASPGITYYMRVRAYNGYWSGYSNTVQTTTIPPAPTATAATNIAASSLRANWNSSSGANGYYVELATNAGFTGYSNYDAGNNTSLVISPLTGYTTYYYRVRAYNAGGTSGYSGTISARTLVATPYQVTANPEIIATGQSSNLNATSPNCSIRWFNASSGGEPIGTSASGANFSVSPTQTTTYYAEGYNGTTSLSTLSNILANFNSNYSNITSNIPNRYDFAMDGSGGVNSNFISDGGNDMYDGGNYLATELQSQMAYSDNVISSANFGSGGGYFTRYVPGLFILVADMNNINYFQITGNNGADGGGMVDATILSITVNNIAYNCYLKRVYNATDPSINQMIIIPQNNAASHWYDSNSDSSGQHVINLYATNRLYYLLYSGSGGSYIDNTWATNIATAFLTQVNAASGESVSSARTAVTVTVLNVPNVASVDTPLDGATDINVNQSLQWIAPLGGDQPSSYNIYFGMNNPPQSLAHSQAASQTSYDPGVLNYSQTYYWQIIPINSSGAAPNCPIWSFTTTDLYVENDLDPVVPNPSEPEISIFPTIQITGVSGAFTPTIQTTWNPPNLPFANAGLAIMISNAPLSGRTIVIDPDLGFIPNDIVYRLGDSGSWTQVLRQLDWTVDYVYFTLASSKADDDLEIIFPAEENQTLAINLTSFAAILTAGASVMLNWVVASETDHLGYNVLRADSESISSAERINTAIISEGLNYGTEIHYSYLDEEITGVDTYYYWLESICLSGTAEYYGPVSVYVSEEQPSIPGIPNLTTLGKAFPNPFNPIVILPYSLKEASDITIEIFNMRGQKVWQSSQYHNIAGSYNLTWDARDDKGKLLPSGLYYYRMTAGSYQEIRKMTLQK